METTVLDHIPFELDAAQMMSKLHVQAGSSDAGELQLLVRDALAIARPKALYGLGFITTKTDDSVIIDGVRLTSRVLRVNLELAHRAFLYVATCGMELESWSRSMGDLLHRYWADAIKEMALRAASKTLNAHLLHKYRPGKTAIMSPGSLLDWPITQQRPLFALLGDPEASIGVELTERCLMVPNKSVSGIRFATEESFESCQLCPREVCPGRRAPYDPTLYDGKYRLQADLRRPA